MKESKKTMVLRSENPTLRDWVVKNLSAGDLAAVCSASRNAVFFGGYHPLNDEKMAAGVFRAYRQDAIDCLRYEFESLEHFGVMRGQEATWDAFYHHALITAIALMVKEYPELLTQTLAAPSNDI